MFVILMTDNYKEMKHTSYVLHHMTATGRVVATVGCIRNSCLEDLPPTALTSDLSHMPPCLWLSGSSVVLKFSVLSRNGEGTGEHTQSGTHRRSRVVIVSVLCFCGEAW